MSDDFPRTEWMSLHYAWNHYKAHIPAGPPMTEAQWKTVQVVFFVGALSVIDRLRSAIKVLEKHDMEPPPDWLADMIREWRREIDEHGRAMMRYDGVPEPPSEEIH